MGGRRIITKDGRVEVWQSNRLIAYVDPETDFLCALNSNGYVEKRIDLIYHESQILPLLDEHAKNAKRN